MIDKRIISRIIPLLYIHGEVLSKKIIGNILSLTEEEINNAEKEMISALESVGLNLSITDETLQIVTQASSAEDIVQLHKKELEGELTSSQLQALTIVAYAHPIHKDDIALLRGVQSHVTLRTLHTRGLIDKKNDIYSLTQEAMHHLGITETSKLPYFKEYSEALQQKLQTIKQTVE